MIYVLVLFLFSSLNLSFEIGESRLIIRSKNIIQLLLSLIINSTSFQFQHLSLDKKRHSHHLIMALMIFYTNLILHTEKLMHIECKRPILTLYNYFMAGQGLETEYFDLYQFSYHDASLGFFSCSFHFL